MNRALTFSAGMAATLAFGALWHGPLGAGERFASRADRISRATLDYYELPAVSARLERHPLKRQIILSGPADSFQRSELLRIMRQVPGVSTVRWDPASLPPRASPMSLPLLVESELMGLLGFGLGLLLTYLLELRRRGQRFARKW